jgi:SAM-dependent methyltransferase
VPDSSAVLQTEAQPEVIEEIDTAALARTWWQDFGVDVGPAFEGIPMLRLCRGPATNRVFFDPPIAGSPDFYAQLRWFDWYHPSEKAEHRLAGATIGPEDRVLDIGAGDGAFADHVNGAIYEGLEFDPQIVQAARNRGHDISDRPLSQVAAEVTDGTQQPYTVATAFQVLEHMPDPDTFVADALRCLTPGGRLILGVPDRDTYVSALPDFALNAPPHHLTWWNAGSIRALLHGHGVRHLTFYWTPVEHWERRFWWMARIAGLLQRSDAPRFGPSRRRMKIFAWLMAGLLKSIKQPADVRGATLVVSARKPDVI